MKNVFGAAARLRCEEVAVILNCKKEDITTLIAKRLLKPLGNPANNATKYFARTVIEAQVLDDKWLGKVTDALYDASRTKNENRRSKIVPFHGKENVA